ncbi:MAG: tyrosine-protein phosphatase [Clostridia bacterium]|nr:tyrosine-protein phosphatase [Clostridia bacterium]
MKKTITRRFLAALLVIAMALSFIGVIPAGAAASTSDGYITNGDFETGAASPWVLGEGGFIVTGGHNGSAYAVKLSGTKAWLRITQDITVEPNTDYRLTGWVKRVSGTGAHYLYAKGPNNANISAINGTKQYFTYMDEDWVMHKWEFNSGSYTSITICMVIEDPDSVFLYDDITIKPIPKQSFDGYLYNGNFETGDATSWSIKSPSEVVAGGHNSDYAFRFEGSQWTSASQYITVEPNTDYRLTGWVKRVSGTGAHYLYAKDPNGGSLAVLDGSKQWFNHTTTDWVEHVWEFNSGPYSSVRIYLTIEDAKSVFLYDDIKVEKLGTASYDGYITNGNFETGRSSGWVLNENASVVSGGFNGSEYGLKAGGNAGSVVKQDVVVEGLTDYRITVHVRRISGRGAHRIVIKKGDTVLETINGTDGTFSYTAKQWKEHTVEFNSGKATLLTVCLQVEANSSVFVYDDIVMEKIVGPDYSDVLKGDLTLDGAIGDADLTLMESFIAGGAELEGAAEYAADMNYDGSVTAADAELLRAYFSGSAAVLLYPAKGETVAKASWQVEELLTNYTVGKTDEYSGVSSRKDQYMRDPVVLHWLSAPAGSYTVLLADNRALTGAKTYTVTEPTLSIQNLMVNTDYYWAVEVNGARSEVGRFHTENTIRTLWIEGVSNTRDLGGWKTADGKQRVKYGIAYRGAKFDDITPAGKQAILDLGLKTDVDLRGHNEGIDEPLASIGVNHIFGSTYGCAMYNGTDSTSIERFGSNHVNGTINALRAYANPANYPAYFHCSYGRDRTGTLGLLLLGLLGVSKVDIQKDYEMTFLSEWGGGGLSAAGHTDILNRTISWLANRYKGSTLQENVEAYVLEAGLTAEEVAAIRANMLERASTLAGDVDYDGTVGVTDALMSLRASLGLAEIAEEDFSYADADGDGIITVSDVLIILRIAAYLV